MHMSWAIAIPAGLLICGCASETEGNEGKKASAEPASASSQAISASATTPVAAVVPSEPATATAPVLSVSPTKPATATPAPIDVSRCIEARKTEWETISVYCTVSKEWRSDKLIDLTARVSEAVGRTIQSKKVDTGTAKFIHVTVVPPVGKADSEAANTDPLRVSYFVYDLKSANYDKLGPVGVLDLAIDVQTHPKSLTASKDWCKARRKLAPNFCAKADVVSSASLEGARPAKRPVKSS